MCLHLWEVTPLSWQNFWWGLSVERSLSCAECVDFFKKSHPMNILQQTAVAIKQKCIWFRYQQNTCSITWILNQKLCQTSNFFIVSAEKVSWKQNHTPELINADLKVPFQEDGLLGRNSSSLVWMRQLVPFWSTVRQHLCHWGCSPGLWDVSCQQGREDSTWLRLQPCKAPAALRGLACCSFSISCKKEFSFLCQHLWCSL